MAIRIREFATIVEMEDFLQGKLYGAQINPRDGVDVRGLTLTFTTPAATVTFPTTDVFATANSALIVAEINSQAGAGTAGARNYGYNLGQTIILVNPGDVLTGGTALPRLGIPTGTVGGAAVAKADIIQVFVNRPNSIAVVYDA